MPWRGDSHLGDQYNGSSLLGGWYDDGGTIKMTYTVATSVMMLAWGLQEFKTVGGVAQPPAAALFSSCCHRGTSPHAPPVP